jgi:hypothetical protein
VREKGMKTMTDKYGEKYSMQIDFIKKEILENGKITKKKNILKQYKDDGIIDIDDNYLYIMKCNKNHTFKIPNHIFLLRKKYKTIICTICNPINNHNSGYEKQLCNFIMKNYDDEILINSRNIIPPLELDIYLPEIKLAFEFNGLYWHHEINKLANYHLNKTELCEEQGIKLVHIYEDDWLYKQEIVKSMILYFLNKLTIISSDNCEIREISSKESTIFLDKNYIYEYKKYQYNIGLFFNEELVSLMFFNKKKNPNEHQMFGYCSKLNYNIIGGEFKLFNFFIEKYNSEIIEYNVNRNWFYKDLCYKLGFIELSKIPPDYHYIIDGIRVNKNCFSKKILMKQGFDKNKTEHEIMLERKIYRIYDSGHLKFLFKNQ